MEDLKELARMARMVAAQVATREAAQVADALARMAREAADTRPTWVREFDREAARAEYVRAADARADLWVTAGCGSEEPMLRGGEWAIYQYNPATRGTRYLYPGSMRAEPMDS